jgi:hypothetical protein
MDKATLEFLIRDGLASRAHITGIVSGSRAEAIVAGVLEQVEPEVETLCKIIVELLEHLPDSGYEGHGDESWDWCWNELSSSAQDAVLAVRARARRALGLGVGK